MSGRRPSLRDVEPAPSRSRTPSAGSRRRGSSAGSSTPRTEPVDDGSSSFSSEISSSGRSLGSDDCAGFGSDEEVTAHRGLPAPVALRAVVNAYAGQQQFLADHRDGKLKVEDGDEAALRQRRSTLTQFPGGDPRTFGAATDPFGHGDGRRPTKATLPFSRFGRVLDRCSDHVDGVCGDARVVMHARPRCDTSDDGGGGGRDTMRSSVDDLTSVATTNDDPFHPPRSATASRRGHRHRHHRYSDEQSTFVGLPLWAIVRTFFVSSYTRLAEGPVVSSAAAAYRRAQVERGFSQETEPFPVAAEGDGGRGRRGGFGWRLSLCVMQWFPSDSATTSAYRCVQFTQRVILLVLVAMTLIVFVFAMFQVQDLRDKLVEQRFAALTSPAASARIPATNAAASVADGSATARLTAPEVEALLARRLSDVAATADGPRALPVVATRVADAVATPPVSGGVAEAVNAQPPAAGGGTAANESSKVSGRFRVMDHRTTLRYRLDSSASLFGDVSGALATTPAALTAVLSKESASTTSGAQVWANTVDGTATTTPPAERRKEVSFAGCTTTVTTQAPFTVGLGKLDPASAAASAAAATAAKTANANEDTAHRGAQEQSATTAPPHPPRRPALLCVHKDTTAMAYDAVTGAALWTTALNFTAQLEQAFAFTDPRTIGGDASSPFPTSPATAANATGTADGDIKGHSSLGATSVLAVHSGDRAGRLWSSDVFGSTAAETAAKSDERSPTVRANVEWICAADAEGIVVYHCSPRNVFSLHTGPACVRYLVKPLYKRTAWASRAPGAPRDADARDAAAGGDAANDENSAHAFPFRHVSQCELHTDDTLTPYGGQDESQLTGGPTVHGLVRFDDGYVMLFTVAIPSLFAVTARSTEQEAARRHTVLSVAVESAATVDRQRFQKQNPDGPAPYWTHRSGDVADGTAEVRLQSGVRLFVSTPVLFPQVARLSVHGVLVRQKHTLLPRNQRSVLFGALPQSTAQDTTKTFAAAATVFTVLAEVSAAVERTNTTAAGGAGTNRGGPSAVHFRLFELQFARLYELGASFTPGPHGRSDEDGGEIDMAGLSVTYVKATHVSKLIADFPGDVVTGGDSSQTASESVTDRRHCLEPNAPLIAYSRSLAFSAPSSSAATPQQRTANALSADDVSNARATPAEARGAKAQSTASSAGQAPPYDRWPTALSGEQTRAFRTQFVFFLTPAHPWVAVVAGRVVHFVPAGQPAPTTPSAPLRFSGIAFDLTTGTSAATGAVGLTPLHRYRTRDVALDADLKDDAAVLNDVMRDGASAAAGSVHGERTSRRRAFRPNEDGSEGFSAAAASTSAATRRRTSIVVSAALQQNTADQRSSEGDDVTAALAKATSMHNVLCGFESQTPATAAGDLEAEPVVSPPSGYRGQRLVIRSASLAKTDRTVAPHTTAELSGATPEQLQRIKNEHLTFIVHASYLARRKTAAATTGGEAGGETMPSESPGSPGSWESATPWAVTDDSVDASQLTKPQRTSRYGSVNGLVAAPAKPKRVKADASTSDDTIARRRSEPTLFTASTSAATPTSSSLSQGVNGLSAEKVSPTSPGVVATQAAARKAAAAAGANTVTFSTVTYDVVDIVLRVSSFSPFVHDFASLAPATSASDAALTPTTPTSRGAGTERRVPMRVVELPSALFAPRPVASTVGGARAAPAVVRAPPSEGSVGPRAGSKYDDASSLAPSPVFGRQSAAAAGCSAATGAGGGGGGPVPILFDFTATSYDSSLQISDPADDTTGSAGDTSAAAKDNGVSQGRGVAAQMARVDPQNADGMFERPAAVAAVELSPRASNIVDAAFLAAATAHTDVQGQQVEVPRSAPPPYCPASEAAAVAPSLPAPLDVRVMDPAGPAAWAKAVVMQGPPGEAETGAAPAVAVVDDDAAWHIVGAAADGATLLYDPLTAKTKLDVDVSL